MSQMIWMGMALSRESCCLAQSETGISSERPQLSSWASPAREGSTVRRRFRTLRGRSTAEPNHRTTARTHHRPHARPLKDVRSFLCGPRLAASADAGV
jgi:hypothetical protein